MSLMLMTDGYKLDHRRQYPEGTEYVYSNFTPRSSRVGNSKVIFFGLQYFLDKYFMAEANRTFFSRNKEHVLDDYRRMLKQYLGHDSAAAIGVDHIAALHDLGYIPLRFSALPEGTAVPLKVPMFVLENTHPDFFWVTNYFETLMSNVLWKACTSATTAAQFNSIFYKAAARTGGPAGFVQWQGHDFSFRGMSSPEDAALSGAGHLLSFTGTDTIPAISLLEDYYDAVGLIGGSVPATEHSVMCAGSKEDEIGTFRRLLGLYPKGIVSVVSDTWDLWEVLGVYLPKLKEQILARDGKLVIRPDSGDPVLILCGNSLGDHELEVKGVIECLWDIFGGTVNRKGFRELDSHIGAIYGDSITKEPAEDICKRLEEKGFASTNWVAGIGSYTYQYVTRDTNGFAMKATWARINGEERFLFKDPITDNGMKRSARGRMIVVEDGLHGIRMIDGYEKSYDDYASRQGFNLLKPVWENGQFLRRTNLDEIRDHVLRGFVR